jgi:predicted Zn-ribbon and HTH transcriptional regulator
MSISMDRFATTGQFASYDRFNHTSQRIAVFSLQCRHCGFEAEDCVTAPRLCPKCHGNSWERFAKPGSVLENAQRY